MKKNKLILLQIIIAVILICTSVYATVNTTISLSASSTTVKQGEEITVKLSLENVDADKKVYSVEGYINYDKDILEPITVDSIEKTDNNTVKIGNEELSIQDITNNSENISDYGITINRAPSGGNDVKILIDFRNGISSNTDLLNIKFKVKSDAKLGTVTNAISYKSFEITAGTETSAGMDKNVNLTVVSNEHTHSYKEEIVKEATCTEKGKKVEKCSCGDIKEEKEINALGHSFGSWKVVKEATTDATGTRERVCTRCNEKETETIAKLSKPSNTNTNTNTNTNKNTNTNTNTNTNKNSNTNKTNNTNTDGTVAGTKLPATGAKVIVAPAIVLIVLAYISYNRYMKYKDI